MDCRNGLLFCLGLLVPLAGCVREVRTEGEDKAGEQVIKKPETFVAFADFRAAASFAPETPAADREVYREEARAGYLKAIEMNPKHVPAYLALARLQQASNDMAPALGTYKKAPRGVGQGRHDLVRTGHVPGAAKAVRRVRVELPEGVRIP